MNKYLNIALVGTGNVAWHLGPALENAGHRVAEVYGREPQALKKMLGRLYNAEPNDSLDFSDKNLDLVILCVADRAIEAVAKEIVMDPETILAHTAGNTGMDRLRYAGTDHFGVFYPLQTFSKAKGVDLKQVPLCVEGSSKAVEKTLFALGQSLSDRVHAVSSANRKSLHVGAVFACNFTNHLLRISKEVLRRRGMDFEMLHPLLVETLNKGIELGPEKAQTGPAARGDFETLDRHMDILAGEPEYRDIYQKITQNILDTYYYQDEEA